ncbi:MAG: Ppx/GppA phosphatase family protein [Syntrophaceticus sp.]|nr:Ppx/GppA phosphatase family protein [Syntrophaceticus sp.]
MMERESALKRIVIIDVGSNTIRLILVRIGENGNYKIIHDLKESVRLERDMGEEQIIKPDRMEKAVQTLQMFRNLCNALHPEEVIAVATEAVRRAANQQEFLDKVKKETGFAIRVLSSEEEAHYDYIGIIASIDIKDGLLVDLGGGSTELISLDNGEATDAISLPFGSVNLSEQYELHDTVQKKQIGALNEMLLNTYSSVPWLAEKKYPFLIGTGGAFRNLGKIDRRRKDYPLEISHNYRMQASDVWAIHNIVSSSTLKQRCAIKGLSQDRADIFVGSTAVISQLLEYCGIEKVAISGYGMREGIIYDYVYRNHQPHPDVLDYSINNNLLNYELDPNHAVTVWKVTSSLCRQLKKIGKMSEKHGRIIKAACMLHDAGIAINFYQQNEHLMYTFLNSEINGLSHREIVMSAYIAAYRYNHHSPLLRYKPLLDQDDVRVIQEIRVLLRIARCLDRSMSGLVKDVTCNIRDDKVLIKTIADGNIELEIQDALRYADAFKKVFHKDLAIS